MPERDWNRVHQIAPEPQPGRITRWASWAATVVLLTVLSGTIGACTPYWIALGFTDARSVTRRSATRWIDRDTPRAASFRFALGAAAGTVIGVVTLVVVERKRGGQ